MPTKMYKIPPTLKVPHSWAAKWEGEFVLHNPPLNFDVLETPSTFTLNQKSLPLVTQTHQKFDALEKEHLARNAALHERNAKRAVGESGAAGDDDMGLIANPQTTADVKENKRRLKDAKRAKALMKGIKPRVQRMRP